MNRGGDRAQPFRAIAAELRDLINRKAEGYRPGDTLPSVNKLREGVAEVPSAQDRNQVTITRAIELLRADGLVVSMHGVGTKVRRPYRMKYRLHDTHDPARLTDLPPTSDGWLRDVEVAGYLGTQTISVGTVLGNTPLDDATVGGRLGIGPEDVAVVRERIRSIAERPGEGEQPRYERESVSRSYYSMRLAAGTPLMSKEGANTALILHEAGHPQVDFSHEMVSRWPTPDEADKLGVRGSLPVMERITVARDPEGEPVYVQHVVTIGNGSKFLINLSYT
jgi:DNA-binding GntR family transcriptional regulator